MLLLLDYHPTVSNARKLMERVEVKKVRRVRVKKLKVDLSALPDAIIEGKFIVPLNGKVIFERSLDQKRVVHKGYVFNINEERGDVTLWDENREQFYAFSLKEPPVIKILA